MGKLFCYFQKENLSIPEATEFIILAPLFYIIFSLSISIIALNFNIVFPRPSSLQVSQIIYLLIKVAEEEAGYRFMPLVLAVEKWGSSRKIWLVVLIISVLFGLRHGSYLLILQQGVFGMILSLVFLKCGGFGKKYLRAYVASITAHALVDCSSRYGLIEVLRKLFFYVFVYLVNITT